MTASSSITYIRRRRGERLGVGLGIAAAAVVAVLLTYGGREADHPQWAAATREVTDSSPLIISARYDAANHFVLVDIPHGVADAVVQRLACEGVLPMLERVDSSVRFALYEAPDRLRAHKDDCSGS